MGKKNRKRGAKRSKGNKYSFDKSYAKLKNSIEEHEHKTIDFALKKIIQHKISSEQFAKLIKLFVENKFFPIEAFDFLNTHISDNINEFSQQQMSYVIRFYAESQISPNEAEILDDILLKYIELNSGNIASYTELASFYKSLLYLALEEKIDLKSILGNKAFKRLLVTSSFNVKKSLDSGSLSLDAKSFIHSFLRFHKYILSEDHLSNALGIKLKIDEPAESIIKSYVEYYDIKSGLDLKLRKWVKGFLEDNSYDFLFLQEYSPITLSCFDLRIQIDGEEFWMQFDSPLYHTFTYYQGQNEELRTNTSTIINTKLAELGNYRLLRFNGEELNDHILFTEKLEQEISVFFASQYEEDKAIDPDEIYISDVSEYKKEYKEDESEDESQIILSTQNESFWYSELMMMFIEENIQSIIDFTISLAQKSQEEIDNKKYVDFAQTLAMKSLKFLPLYEGRCGEEINEIIDILTSVNGFDKFEFFKHISINSDAYNTDIFSQLSLVSTANRYLRENYSLYYANKHPVLKLHDRDDFQSTLNLFLSQNHFKFKEFLKRLDHLFSKENLKNFHEEILAEISKNNPEAQKSNSTILMGNQMFNIITLLSFQIICNKEKELCMQIIKDLFKLKHSEVNVCNYAMANLSRYLSHSYDWQLNNLNSFMFYFLNSLNLNQKYLDAANDIKGVLREEVEKLLQLQQQEEKEILKKSYKNIICHSNAQAYLLFIDSSYDLRPELIDALSSVGPIGIDFLLLRYTKYPTPLNAEIINFAYKDKTDALRSSIINFIDESSEQIQDFITNNSDPSKELSVVFWKKALELHNTPDTYWANREKLLNMAKEKDLQLDL